MPWLTGPSRNCRRESASKPGNAEQNHICVSPYLLPVPSSPKPAPVKMGHVSAAERFMEPRWGSKSPCPPMYKAPVRPGELPKPLETWKKGGRMLSVLLAVNTLLLACTLISSGAFNKVAVYDTDVFALLAAMMLLAVIWVVAHLLHTTRHPDAVPYRDPHAGPIWLRGGLVLFAVCTLVMDVFKTGYYSSFFECQAAIKILFPILQALFVIVQVALKVGSLPAPLSRCGLMFTLTTNLAIWALAVVDEPGARVTAPPLRLAERGGGAGSSEGDRCTCNTTICRVFEQGYFYLYPFNIEYSLFAATLLYVMWKNVGRLLSPGHGHGHGSGHGLGHGLSRQTLFVGPLLGLLLFVGGLGVFVVYEVQVRRDGENRTRNALVLYYSFHIVCLGLMSLGSLGGSILYRLDRRTMDQLKNPTRTLDVALLMGAALGQFAISYYSIVAVVAGAPRELLGALNLAHSLLTIAQLSSQNAFIIESLHRSPPEPEAQHPEPGLAFANPVAPLALSPSPLSRALPQLWIMPAFGARPQFTNNLELNFYGSSMWLTIVNICLPFGNFLPHARRLQPAGGLCAILTGAWVPGPPPPVPSQLGQPFRAPPGGGGGGAFPPLQPTSPPPSPTPSLISGGLGTKPGFTGLSDRKYPGPGLLGWTEFRSRPAPRGKWELAQASRLRVGDGDFGPYRTRPLFSRIGMNKRDLDPCAFACSSVLHRAHLLGAGVRGRCRERGSRGPFQSRTGSRDRAGLARTEGPSPRGHRGRWRGRRPCRPLCSACFFFVLPGN
uniref:Otopetrin 2 n=1 Tax=Ornithorhynchus anatinus TaxID=9258 RepID=A0A6I8NZ53_ORNAN